VSSNHSIIYAHITYCNNAGLIACKPSSLRPVLLYWWVLPRSLTIWGCWEQNNHHSTYGRVSTVSIVIGVLISSRLQYAIITSFKLIVRLAIANRQVSNFHFTKQTESRSLVWKAVAGVAALHLLPRPGDSQHIYQEDPTNDANVWWYTCSTLRFLSMVLAEDDWRVGKIREPTQIEISSKIFRGFVFLPMAITSRGSKCVSVQRVQHKNPSVLASFSKALPASAAAAAFRLSGQSFGMARQCQHAQSYPRDTSIYLMEIAWLPTRAQNTARLSARDTHHGCKIKNIDARHSSKRPLFFRRRSFGWTLVGPQALWLHWQGSKTA